MPLWLSPLLGFIQPVLDKFFPDKVKQQEFTFQLQQLAATQAAQELEDNFKLAIAQTETNTAEAKSSNLFVSGWRPAIGWICAIALAYAFLIQPLLAWASGIWHIVAPPVLDIGTLMTLLFGMLGLGTLHTAERIKGVVPEEQPTPKK